MKRCIVELHQGALGGAWSNAVRTLCDRIVDVEQANRYGNRPAGYEIDGRPIPGGCTSAATGR
jgi:hypothetical protein